MPWVLDEIIQAEVDRLKRLRAMVDNMPPTNVTLVSPQSRSHLQMNLQEQQRTSLEDLHL